jgi:predicted anti-sigma-YlaC factor YlaD
LKHIHINCSDFVAEIGNLLDGDVDPALKAHLEAHLAICKACTVVYDSTRKTLHIVADTEVFELSAMELKSGTQAIMERIRLVQKLRGEVS